MSGEWFLASVLCGTLTKLALRTLEITEISQVVKNMTVSEALLAMASIVRFGQSKQCSTPIEQDALERIIFCVKVLTNPSPITRQVFLTDSRQAFHLFVTEQEKTKPKREEYHEHPLVHTDECIKIRQLRRDTNYQADEEGGDDDLEQATGVHEYDADDDSSNLGRVYQLTGYSDPIYAEAYINVHTYDISLEVLVINQTPETLQNVALELATVGDLKLIEKPQNVSISPHDSNTIRSNIKIASTETGVIFGNIVFDIAGVSSSDKNCVVLNDIHIDALDYIQPADCTHSNFLSMWAEFEWENRILVNTNIVNLSKFLTHICKVTNMKCLTPASSFNEDCGFLSANLYARSVFGEDALANISIEMIENKITGFIRLRSRTQGIALSLGDRITSKQRVDDLAASSSTPAPSQKLTGKEEQE